MSKGETTQNWPQRWAQVQSGDSQAQLGVLTEIFQTETDAEIIALGLLADEELVRQAASARRNEQAHALLLMRQG